MPPTPPQIAALPLLDLQDNFERTRLCVPGYRHSARGRLRRATGRAWLQRGGWTTHGVLPDVPRAVLVCYPHTSNWDFAALLFLMQALDVEPAWVGKDSLFRPPVGRLTRALGGIAVQRGANANQSQRVAEAMLRMDQCLLAIAPEGTRHHCTRWKTGFWHIARAAEVPLVLGFLDYARRQVGFGPLLLPSDDIDADFVRIAPFFEGVLGKFPDQQGPIALRAV
ncbi:MAG: 1-acyl-sn-glycerol-3-phosphate acyltransferase [Deltaproteobacteria bacterium]|nr:1-acyl-sn-glycerol-3-phosphate acyltransferase [Deltaproteobacteria bacterium]